MEFGSWTDGMKSGVKNAYDYYYLANPYLDMIKSGKVGTKELDEKVRRILRLVFRTTMARRVLTARLRLKDTLLPAARLHRKVLCC